MARRKDTEAPKGGADTAPKGEGVKSDTGGTPVALISGGALRTLNKQMTKFQNDASTATGSMGDLTRDYADKKNLHKGAYATIKMLNRMGQKDPGKLWLWLAHFDHMRKQEAFGQKFDETLDVLAKSQGQLVGAGAEDDEAETEQPGAPGSTAKTGDQVRQVAETAGAKLN